MPNPQHSDYAFEVVKLALEVANGISLNPIHLCFLFWTQFRQRFAGRRFTTGHARSLSNDGGY